MKKANVYSILEANPQIKPVYNDLTEVEERAFVVEFEGYPITCSYDDNYRVWFPKHDIERVLFGQPVTEKPTIIDARTLRLMSEELQSRGIDPAAVGFVDKINRVLGAIEEACPVETDIFDDSGG